MGPFPGAEHRRCRPAAPGRQALERADWESARSAFTAVLEDGDSPDARDGLAQALWFLGHVREALDLRERVFEDYVRAGRCDDAARVAVWVSHQHMVGGRASAARGWLARSERALQGVPACAGHGWVAVEQVRQSIRVDDQIAHATRALDVGRTTGQSDLEVLSVSLLGRARVNAGHREEGLHLLEEAMAAATAGRVRDVHTLAEAYCNLVLACRSAGEWELASEWCELVDAFARAHSAAPLLGACRTVHADVLIAGGHWAEAERALQAALATHARNIPAMGAPTVGSLAELRVQQGRLPEAEELLAGREEHPAVLRALALLRMADGRARAAVTLLERGLAGAEDNAVAAAHFLAPLVDARLALGDVPGARAAAGELGRLAEASGIRLLAARADLAAAAVALRVGEAAQAVEPARRALAAFSALLMPLDAGTARLALARAIAADAPDTASDEARAALTAFRGLGASRAMDAAAALLRGLGTGQGGRARAVGELTAREEEVLGLLSLSMSNAGIARSLLISERTAGHHVSRILTKLGVRNRAEAAAYAARARTAG
ncbi:LuxR C-terminal-related transcriptional regulator [Blastococcus sp. PRF04-17]|uniref:LuxR C-terminal-related transcriptional regulator n=1 Tax=Blastococcus sp. PRF04-17 TaxID=2933797 RepID=UPI001FF3028A|nr:LuxR C-terminal-related transcriptional regulator [Blastococcus sp. PRF04-17]UOY02393.1 LuxR C-terminal-related transcriptional regulator [Blastococcus sp. PRF04-17]